MKVKQVVAILTIILAMSMMIGCAKAPQQDIDAAKAALEAAKAAEADRYVPAQYNAVKDSVDTALAEVERQNSKFVLFRSYGKVQKKLQEALAAANAAKDGATVEKEKVKAEAQELLTQAQAAGEETKKLMKKAPRGKEGRAALEAIQSDLTTAEAGLAEANTAMTNGDVLTARDKAKASLEKINSLNQELQDAIAKKKGMSR
jgi:hypothetical protein